MSEEPRKRSRFDQTEPPEHRRASRFDRRSHSPPTRKADSARSRSPLAKTSSPAESGARADAAARAAEAAARINASIQAKKAIQTVDVPPIRTVCETSTIPSQARELITNSLHPLQLSRPALDRQA